MRVVSVGDKKSINRLLNLVHVAILDDRTLHLTPDQWSALDKALIQQVRETGLAITWQVGEAK
jgi:hypothetical protein